MDIQLVKGYLHKLGLTHEAALIYLALIGQGPQSISDIARHSHVERTKVYRTIPDLQAVGLVDSIADSERTVFSATPFDNVQVLLTQKEQQLDDLKHATPYVARALRELSSQAPRTGVKVYRGPQGIKQMLWNETKASGELLSILRHGVQLDTRQKFFDRWAAACNKRGLTARSITHADFESKIQDWREHRDVERLLQWQGRTIDPGTFTIYHDIIIYDNTVGYFYWGKDEMFGIEITNQLVADVQRQFFELLWSMAQ